MSFFDDASLVFLPSGAAGKDGKAYSIKPVPEFGSEKVTNGTFSTDSDWTKGTGWTISGGTASCDGSQSGNSILYQNISHSANKKYRVEFTISGYVSGQVDFALDTPFFGATTSNGTFIFDAIPPSGGNFIIRADADFVGSIDNVSVKEITKTGDFTFSRGSNLAATRVGADGLIEKGRENLLTYSNQFDTTWGSVGVTSASGQSGYDGSTDAWLLTDTATSGDHRLYIANSHSGVHTLSVYAKAETKSIVYIQSYINNSSAAYFDLSDGSVLSTTSDIESKIESVANGWYRCSITFNNTNSYITIGMAESATRSYVGDGTGTIYIQDAQLEIGLAVTDVIETGATTGKAGLLEDEPRFDYSGGATCPSLLLEPSRTQLVKYSELGSEYTIQGVGITNNETNSPEGLQNAFKVLETATTGNHGVYQNVNLSANTDYAVSVFVKKLGRRYVGLQSWYGEGNGAIIYADLDDGTIEGTYAEGTGYSVSNTSIVDYGNDWYRISGVFQSGNTGQYYGLVSMDELWTTGTSYGNSYAGDVTKGFYSYGLQVEAGSYPTSYIPNHSGGSVTRGADVCNSAGDSSTFNDSEGVLYAEISALANDGINRVITIVNSSTTINRVRLYYTTVDNRVIAEIRNASGGFLMIYNGLSNATTFNKFAVKYKNNDSALWVNGTEVLTNTSGGVPVGLNSLNFDDGSGSDDFYGKTKQILTFKTALSDSELATLTTI